MRCPHCGAENPLSQTYCRGCGKKIDVDFAMIQEAVEIDDEAAKAKKTTTRALVPVIALLVTANIIVWIFGSQFRARSPYSERSLPVPAAPPPEMPVAPLEVPRVPAVPGAPLRATSGPLPLPDHVGSPSGRFSFRRGATKDELHARRAGTPEVLRAVRRGLVRLAAHQAKASGRWSVRGAWEKGSERGGDIAVTGLAVLALLGDGHVWTGADMRPQDRGPRWYEPLGRAAGLGVRFLVTKVGPSGRLGKAEGRHMYDQGIAAAALSEAYAMTGLQQLRAPAQRAVSFIVKCQRQNGGWDYVAAEGTRSDMSVTVWQVTALDAARRAGLEVPREAFEKVESFVHMMTSSASAVAQYETEPFSQRRPMFSEFGSTAMALACKAMLGRPGHSKAVTDQSRVLLAHPPVWDGKWVKETAQRLHVYSYWHHGTVGMRPLGERTWREWYAAAAGALLAAQDEDGSWPPAGRWAHAGGRVYTTALAILTLEATYRYP